MSGSKIFGIDLGTTYSAIAWIDGFGQPEVLLNENDEPLIPSALYYESSGEVLVGTVAKKSAPIDPSRFVDMIKPNMGEAGSCWSIEGVDHRPEEASALILKRLKQIAEERTGQTVTDVIITVPAYFDERQRHATAQAGKIAGLNVVGLIPEPTAAAIHYATTIDADRNVLVYDLGGGTFDVTVIRTGGEEIRVVCVNGDHRLGGRLWDERLVDHLAQEWRAQTTLAKEPENDPVARQELLILAEETKRLLTARGSVPVRFAFDGAQARIEVTRETFDNLTRDWLDSTISCTRDVVAQAEELGTSRIDLILLVGGSSRMPQVRARLEQEFPDVEIKLHEPDLSVAKGAAIYANNALVQQAYREIAEEYYARKGALPGPSDQRVMSELLLRLPGMETAAVEQALASRKVINVCSKSFAVKTRDRGSSQYHLEFLILRNSPVPSTQTRRFGTYSANQDRVEIAVYESSTEVREEKDYPRDPNHPAVQHLKSVWLDLPAGLPEGHPIEVTYDLSSDGGRLQVSARDPQSGRSIEDSVALQGAMTEQELREAISRVDEVILS